MKLVPSNLLSSINYKKVELYKETNNDIAGDIEIPWREV